MTPFTSSTSKSSISFPESPHTKVFCGAPPLDFNLFRRNARASPLPAPCGNTSRSRPWLNIIFTFNCFQQRTFIRVVIISLILENWTLEVDHYISTVYQKTSFPAKSSHYTSCKCVKNELKWFGDSLTLLHCIKLITAGLTGRRQPYLLFWRKESLNQVKIPNKHIKACGDQNWKPH